MLFISYAPFARALRMALIFTVFAFAAYADGLAAVPVGASAGSDPRPFVIGWEFSVSSPVTVTSLAYLDATSRGLNDAHQIGIFDAGTGLLLVSATIAPGSSLPSLNGFRLTPASYMLNPGKYVVAATRPSDADAAMVRARSVQTVSQITYLQERELQSAQFTMPSNNLQGDEAGDFGPSFTIAEAGGAQGGGSATITGIVNSASFQPVFAPGTYLSIFGTNLAQTTRAWNQSDFGGGSRLPVTLDGLSVTVNGVPAYVEYVSPGQINIITPDMPASPAGIPVTVQYPGRQDVTTWINLQSAAPGLFTWQTGTAASGQYLVAQHTDYTNVGKPGLFPSLQPQFTTPARPGETIILYGTGFGPASPPLAGGLLADKAYPLNPLPTATVGGVNAVLSYAGLVPTLAQVYQFTVTIPPNMPPGDSPLVITVNGAASYPGLITVTN